MNPVNQSMHVAALCFALLVAAACGKTASSESHGKENKEGREPAQAHEESTALKLSDADLASEGVKTVKLAEETVRSGITLTANIAANQDRIAHVAPRVPGRLIEVPAKLGDTVRPGQILALVDSVEVGEASAGYQQAASQLSVAKSEFERSQKLYDEQVVAQKDYLRTRGEYEKARAAHAAALDKLRLMGVNPSGAASATLPVTAPLAGTVIEKHAVIGELAQPDKQLFTVADLSTVWIEANLYEKDLARVKAGSDAVVTVTAYPQERFKGRLAYVSVTVERESRTVKARIEVANRDGRLKPEMFATAVVQTEESARAIAVPPEAVVLIDNQKTVFVKDGGGFEPRPVEIGEVVNDRQVVKAGLKPGDEAVVAGAFALKSRMLKSKIGDSH